MLIFLWETAESSLTRSDRRSGFFGFVGRAIWLKLDSFWLPKKHLACFIHIEGFCALP